MNQTCEWCGQPAVRHDPSLCAECYYKYWSKSKEKTDPLRARVEGSVYSR